MKLEIGKFYRTRDGRKAGPVVRNQLGNPNIYPYWCDSIGSYRQDGSYVSKDEESQLDLVAEWVDGPQAEDAEVVRKFNELVKAGRVQFAPREGLPFLPLLTDNIHRLAPTARRMTLPDSGYEVVVTGGEVKVGCRTFTNAGGLRMDLAALCQTGLTSKSGDLYAHRNGVLYGNYLITWADADALLAFLEGK